MCPPSTRPSAIRLVAAGRVALAERERLFVQAVIARHHGDRRRAALELGISLSTLKRRLRPPSGARAPAPRAEGQI
jgi:transcriptional regulator with PAS, ATPase and Fis domain